MPENNFRQKSDEPLTLIAPVGGVVAGEPLIIGGLFVTPATSAAAGEAFVGEVCAVRRHPKSTSVAFTLGAPVYWDVADEEVNDDTANLCVGHAVLAAASDDTHVLVREIDVPVAAVSSLDTRLDTLEAASVVKQMAADGTQVAMTVSDTYVNFTADALTLAANTIADNDTIEWEAEVLLDAMNAALLTTFSLLIGSLELDAVAITTGDTNDWAKLKGTARCTAIGASSTWQIFGGEGCNSDGGSVTRDTPTLGSGTGPATTSTVTFTPRIKAATGNAGNLATLKNFKIKHHKTFAV